MQIFDQRVNDCREDASIESYECIFDVLGNNSMQMYDCVSPYYGKPSTRFA